MSLCSTTVLNTVLEDSGKDMRPHAPEKQPSENVTAVAHTAHLCLLFIYLF